MKTLGDEILEAAAASRHEITLIAPFVKQDVLAKILSKTSPDVFVRVVARWIPEEIIAGVCDLEILDVIGKRPKSELRLHQLNHSKLYRFDANFFIGSANLTRRAFGWTSPANIELLPIVPGLDDFLSRFEANVVGASMVADAAFRDIIQGQVERLRTMPPALVGVFEDDLVVLSENWLPTCREPERVWQVYSRGEEARRRVIESAFDAAQDDLKALSIEPGLSHEHFRARIAMVLDGMPLVTEIGQRAQVGLSDGDAVELIDRRTNDSGRAPYGSAEMWEILRAWLMYFFPNRYRREASAEVFRVGRVIT